MRNLQKDKSKEKVLSLTLLDKISHLIEKSNP